METFISFFYLIQKSFFAIGPFFLLLGILIFIHELGHFLVARYFDVKVKVFSLGFGPKVLKYKKGGDGLLSVSFSSWRLCSNVWR